MIGGQAKINSDANMHLSNSEISKDIVKTEAEISELKSRTFGNDRVDMMRKRANDDGIAARELFVKKLKNILAYRDQEGIEV